MKNGKKRTSNIFLSKKIMALCVILMMTSVSLFTVATTADEIDDRDYFYVLFDGLPSFEKREQLSEIVEYMAPKPYTCILFNN